MIQNHRKTMILSFNKLSLEIEIMSSQKMPHNPVPKVVAFFDTR